MAKSQQTFNKLEREKNRAKKREAKRKKMAARKEARARGEIKQGIYNNEEKRITHFLQKVNRIL